MSSHSRRTSLQVGEERASNPASRSSRHFVSAIPASPRAKRVGVGLSRGARRDPGESRVSGRDASSRANDRGRAP